MLISWRDAGKAWTEINAEWERLTGKKPGKSSLGNRYARLKANLACVATEDIPHLIAAEVEAVQQIEVEVKELWAKKWARVGKIMEEKGAANYPVSATSRTDVLCITNHLSNSSLQPSRSSSRRSMRITVPLIAHKMTMRWLKKLEGGRILEMDSCIGFACLRSSIPLTVAPFIGGDDTSDVIGIFSVPILHSH